MKKLLFVIGQFRIGGIEKSLVELLSQISDQYDVTVYAPRFDGPYVKDIPANVKIIKGSRFEQMIEYSQSDYRSIGGWVNCFIKALFGWFSLKFGKRIPARLFCLIMGKLPGEYDVAISYSQPRNDKSFHGLENEIVLYATKASKKVTFVHCDFGNYGGNTPYSHTLYKRFDAIAAVSESVACRFGEILPDQADKLYVVNNCCNYAYINIQANDAPMVYRKTCFVSVSRIAKEKGLERCVPIMKRLYDEGYGFEWHIVGGGEKHYVEQLLESIKNYGLEEVIVMEGGQTNPYRYMKNASFLFLPSFHEAAPMVFNEACCLGIRVLTTNTLSAVEFVTNRGVGLVCENDDESIYRMLKNALQGHVPAMADINMAGWNKNVIIQFNKMISKHLTE